MENMTLLERVESLEKERKQFNDRISELELVCYSLVAMALERPEKIDYSRLTHFFNEE